MPGERPQRADPAPRILILGGTTEARDLAARCVESSDLVAVSSLAGAIQAARRPAGEVRMGGFGGAEGLTDYLRDERIAAVVDATHPFAATITTSAKAATAAAGVPLLLLRRPGWTPQPGDAWRRVPSLAAAARLLPGLGERVLLATGRRGVAAFAGVDGCWFLSRSIEPPAPPLPTRLTIVLERGPFTVDGERALLAAHRIEVLVTKDSGGADAKLTAARELSIPVVLVDRPAPPPGASIVATVAQAHAWLRQLV